MRRKLSFGLQAGIALLALHSVLGRAATVVTIAPDWSHVIAVSKTNVAIQDCPEPPLYRGQPLHDKIYKALHDLNADYSRLQPWFPYPALAVAELKPPDKAKTYWDFKLLDDIVADFMTATAGHPVVFQPGTVPAWMLTSAAPTRYPADNQAIDWTYARDGKVNDKTARLFGEYQARLASWYMKGGFKDELGVWHPSGHAYKFAYWEPTNEEDERFSPEEVTRLYDAAVESVRRISPTQKFMGPTLSDTQGNPQFLTYFLNPKNHRPGVSVDIISYHFYTLAESDESPQVMQYTIFRQADSVLATVGYIEAIRHELMPNVPTDINELGSVVNPAEALPMAKPIPNSYWNLAGAAWAYLYGHLAAKGIDILTAAELIDYPGQFATTTLVNWESGEPNARYWVVKLLHDHFGPGDKLIEAQKSEDMKQADPSVQVYAQGFITKQGKREELLVNKRNYAITVSLKGAAGGEEESVDETTKAASQPRKLASDTVQLPASAVAIVTLPH